jgi:hypothetical protein
MDVSRGTAVSGSLRDVRQISQGTVAERARRKDGKSNAATIHHSGFDLCPTPDMWVGRPVSFHPSPGGVTLLTVSSQFRGGS